MTLSFVRKLFNLYPGEGIKALAVSAIALLSSGGAMGAATLIDGQFLERVGPSSLPFVYFWTATALFIAASGFFWGLKRIQPHNLFVAILATSSLFYGMVALLVNSPLHPHCWLLFKSISDALVVMILTGLWTMVDGTYDLQDSKRLFGLFSASFILGAALGSGWVAYSFSLIGARGVIITFSLATLTSCLLSLRCQGKSRAVEEEAEEEVGWRSLVKQILSSRFTLYLLLFNILLGLIEVVSEFHYMSTICETIGGGEANGKVTCFLGKACGWVYIGDMIFGMFVYSRLIKRIGVNNASLLSAGYFLTFFMAGPPLQGVWVAILGLIVVEGVLPVLQDSNSNLLLNAVPKGVKTRFRIATEYLLQPIGMLGGSFLLSLFQGHARYLGLGLAIVAVIIAYSIRRRYSHAIYDTLKVNGIPFGISAAAYLKQLPAKERRQAPAYLLKQIPKLKPSAQLAAFECLVHLSDKHLISEVISALPKLHQKILSDALSLLFFRKMSDHESLIRAVEDLAPQEDALFFLAKKGRGNSKLFECYLSSSSLPLRGAAILTILRKPNDGRREVAHSLLRRLISSLVEKEVACGLEILGALDSPRHTSLLRQFLGHKSPFITKSALYILARLDSLTLVQLQSITRLFAHTKDPKLRIACLEALEGKLTNELIGEMITGSASLCPLQREMVETLLIQVGVEATPLLCSIVSDRARSFSERIVAARALKGLSLAPLEPLIEEEMNQAAFSFYHYHTIKWEGAQLTLLYDQLWRSYCSSIDLITHLLAGSGHDADMLLRALRSGDEKAHSHAVESLEKMSSGKLWERLLALIDDSPLQEKIHLYVKRGGHTLTLAELLAHLRHSPVITEQMVAKIILENKQPTIRDPYVELARA